MTRPVLEKLQINQPERSKPGLDLSPKSDYQNVFLVMIPKQAYYCLMSGVLCNYKYVKLKMNAHFENEKTKGSRHFCLNTTGWNQPI